MACCDGGSCDAAGAVVLASGFVEVEVAAGAGCEAGAVGAGVETGVAAIAGGITGVVGSNDVVAT